MGKPFKKELEKINDTLDWAISLEIEPLKVFFETQTDSPILIVGSGGSFSACQYVADLCRSRGWFAKAITPLEIFYSKPLLNKSKVLFISSSGKNTDILFGFKTALQEETRAIASICMRKDSPLAKLSARYSISTVFEFKIPAGKDGFLATNSLVAFFAIFSKVFNAPIKCLDTNYNTFLIRVQNFVERVSKNQEYTVLYGGWGHSVALDIESKCTEAALGNTLVADYRNFGHGRHHWLAKRGEKSAIIALVSPTEKKLAEKTLAILPRHIPRLIIDSDNESSIGGIELLIKSFFLINALGEIQNIDPGRPGVPEFGSKLYKLNYSSVYKEKKLKGFTTQALLAIKRKAKVSSINNLDDVSLTSWIKEYSAFVNRLNKAKLGGIIFDYDGTLCSAENRFEGPSSEIVSELIRFLEKGFIIGVATGRGKSVRHDLQKVIPEDYWNKIILAYYNGGVVGLLSNNSLPKKNIPNDPIINKVSAAIRPAIDLLKIREKIRPTQITLEIEERNTWIAIKRYIKECIAMSDIKNIEVLESSHSMDIIPSWVSKLNILEHCREMANELGLSSEFLCIGDRGQWPGNDYKLLSTKYSLSVEDTSFDPKSCWNLALSGIKNVDATLLYLKKIEMKNDHMSIKINK